MPRRRQVYPVPDIVEKLDHDIPALVASSPQARYALYMRYQQLQKIRVGMLNAAHAAKKREEPAEFFAWLARQLHLLEERLVRVMEESVRAHPAGPWLLSLYGIGPVLACGVLALCDKPIPFRTAGALWRYAGLDPTRRWQAGEKRPYNARLKALCYNIGDSFCKTSNHVASFYGHIYRSRKAYEVERNQRGAYRDQACDALRYTTDPVARQYYEQGLLPPGRLELRARRYAVKLFLSHVQHVLYFLHHQEHPPHPYALRLPGNRIWLGPPNAELIPGFLERLAKNIILPSVDRNDDDAST